MVFPIYLQEMEVHSGESSGFVKLYISVYIYFLNVYSFNEAITMSRNSDLSSLTIKVMLLTSHAERFEMP